MEIKRHQTVMGRRIGPYEVSGLLGVGGMGMVYRAADTRLRRNVALKFLPKGVMLDSDVMERFRREARVASQLVHPNICTIYDIGEHDGAPYLVMELLEGRNLRDRLAGRSMDLAEVLDISIQVAEALAVASEQGVVHRDLKPANIYITKSGVVKLLDFGLGRIAGPERRGDSVTITAPGARLGTVAYTSPEQALGEAVDGRADVFSLGAAMYEMATHSLPFRGEGPVAMYDAILHKAHAPADKANPLLPPQMVAILDKALAKDKALRYQSAEELRDELKALRRLTESDSRMNTKAMLTPAVAIRAKRKTRPAWPIAAAVAAALCGLGAYAYLGPWQAGPSPRTASFAPLTGETGEEFYPSFAPDGKSFVYSARVLGNWDI